MNKNIVKSLSFKQKNPLLNSFHPICNCPSSSSPQENCLKVLHFISSSLATPWPSGFYLHCSTERALIKVTNDLVAKSNRHSELLWNLSVTFATRLLFLFYMLSAPSTLLLNSKTTPILLSSLLAASS